MSKRLGTLALRDLRAQGIEPTALLSLMARLGSADPVELRGDMAELIEGFDIGRFGAAPTKFDADDLAPLSARYLSALPYGAIAAEIAGIGVPEALGEQFWLAVRGNIAARAEAAAWWQVFRDGATGDVADEDQAFVDEALGLLPDGPFDRDTWRDWTSAVKEKTGRKGKALFMPLRLALTGRTRGPEMAEVMPLLQKMPSRR